MFKKIYDLIRERDELKKRVDILENENDLLAKKLVSLREELNTSFFVPKETYAKIINWREEHFYEKHKFDIMVDLVHKGTLAEEYVFSVASVGVTSTYVCPICGEKFSVKEIKK